LLKTLSEADVKSHAEKAIMYIRAGMTHISKDISNDSLAVLEWLLEVADEETVSSPGAWVKTLNSFCALMGWVPSTSSGWSAAPKAGLRSKDSQSHARQLSVLAIFIRAGLRPTKTSSRSATAYWDNIYQVPKAPMPFSYLNLFGSRRDEDAEMYNDRESRQSIFHKRFLDAMAQGADQAKKEGGAIGRAAAILDQALKDGMEGYEPSTTVAPQDLLDLW
jgi:pre-rRNA-processing protein IPI1